MKRLVLFLVLAASTALAASGADTILSASTFSQWRAERKADWVLRVFTRDVASLALFGYQAQEMRITEEEVAAITRFAAEQGFFELPDVLGTKEMDLPVRSLMLVMNGREKTVTMYGTRHPDGLTADDIAATPGLDTFLVVWSGVRGLFDNPRAADDRKSDLKALREFQKRQTEK